MEPTFIGFGPTKAHVVIFWIKEGDIVSKTVCYTPEDVQDMMDKRCTQGSLYSSFDSYEIKYLRAEKAGA